MALYSPEMGVSRSTVFTALAILLLLLTAEALAAIFVRIYGDRLPSPDPNRFVASPEQARKIASAFDAEVGWRNRYPTPYGERPRALNFEEPILSVFGDSFTHSDEVEHHETWAEAVAFLLKGDVFNFGGSAYGIDQAVLRFERESKRVATPFVILSFTGIDLGRCLGSFWKFQHPIGNFPLTKPRFTVEEDRLFFHPNPAQTAETLAAAVQNPSFVEQLGQGDPFYNPHGLDRLRPPYLLALARPSLWAAVLADSSPLRPWEDPEHVRLAELLFLRFVRGAEARGMTPIIMHLPQSSELHALAERGILPEAVQQLDRLCTQHAFRCWTPIREAAASVDDLAGLYTRGRSGGHMSAEGNRWLSQFVASRVNDLRQHPVPAESATPD